MNTLRFCRCALAMILLLALPCGAQSLNVDFNEEGGAWGAPDSSYAGALLAGEWNAVTGDFPHAGIVDLAGTPTGVSVDIDVPSFWGFNTTPQQTTSGDAGNLLRDYLYSTTSRLTILVDGLEPGWYDVATFHLGRQDFIHPADIWVQGNESTAQHVTGEWSGSLALGETHALHTVFVQDGLLVIDAESTSDAAINGIQLSVVPAPGAAWLVAAPMAGTRRRRRRSA